MSLQCIVLKYDGRLLYLRQNVQSVFYFYRRDLTAGLSFISRSVNQVT